MVKPKILVTGATGKTGAATVVQLLAKGLRVRALVRRVDDRSNALAALGAEIMLGSLEDMKDLLSALGGIQRAYYCPPLAPGALRRATLFAAAAQRCRVEVVVALSQWVADPCHPAVHAREKWLSEQMFQWAPDLDVVTVNPGFFADNYMAALEAMAHFGVMAMPLGEGTNAPPANEDIARVVCGLLIDPAPHIGKSYRPTGPTLLDPSQMAAIFGRVLGRPVSYKNAPISLFLKVAKSLRIDDFVLEELSWFLEDYQRNAFGRGAPTSAVEEISGVAPESFETTVRRYVAVAGWDRRTVKSTIIALHNLVGGLMTRAPNPDSIAERLQLPALTHPVFATESNSWIATHDISKTRPVDP